MRATVSMRKRKAFFNRINLEALINLGYIDAVSVTLSVKLELVLKLIPWVLDVTFVPVKMADCEDTLDIDIPIIDVQAYIRGEGETECRKVVESLRQHGILIVKDIVSMFSYTFLFNSAFHKLSYFQLCYREHRKLIMQISSI